LLSCKIVDGARKKGVFVPKARFALNPTLERRDLSCRAAADSMRRAGNTAENVLPLPGSLSISSVAWCRVSTCFTMARPSPVPPVSRERL